VVDTGTTQQLEPHIVAFLACHDHDDQQIEARRIAQTVDERFRRQMEEAEVIVAAEMNDPVDSTFCDVKKRALLVVGILSLPLTVGGVMGGMFSSTGDDVIALPGKSLQGLWGLGRATVQSYNNPAR
jgi:hypothetical protein